MPGEAQRFAHLVGRTVVVDTDSCLLYAGTLASVDDIALELTDVDVHDVNTSTTTRDLYVINLAKFGIKKNRDRVFVRLPRVISLSTVKDVTLY